MCRLVYEEKRLETVRDTFDSSTALEKLYNINSGVFCLISEPHLLCMWLSFPLPLPKVSIVINNPLGRGYCALLTCQQKCLS